MIIEGKSVQQGCAAIGEISQEGAERIVSSIRSRLLGEKQEMLAALLILCAILVLVCTVKIGFVLAVG